MEGKVSMFSGHSGVGKSTLVNAIEPNLDLKTKAIQLCQSLQGSKLLRNSPNMNES